MISKRIKSSGFGDRAKAALFALIERPILRPRRVSAGAFFAVQEQNRCFPITVMRGRDQIQALVAVAGLK